MRKTAEQIYHYTKAQPPVPFRIIISPGKGPLTLKRNVYYHVDDSAAMTSSHELAQNNPLLKKIWEKTALNNSFQHSSIGRITCDQSACENKICDSPCRKILSRVYVGHVTHSNSFGVFISYLDLDNNKRIQFFVAYDIPVPNHDVTGANINESKTKNLNTVNKDARDMIHLNSPKNKPINPLCDDVQ